MSSRPSGTVTFLFTDIEGSTRMWEEHRAEMPAALEQHDTLLRGAIEAEGGYVFTTAGDAFSAAFTEPASTTARTKRRSSQFELCIHAQPYCISGNGRPSRFRNTILVPIAPIPL